MEKPIGAFHQALKESRLMHVVECALRLFHPTTWEPKLRTFLFSILVLLSSPLFAMEWTAYNKGVDAWIAKDFVEARKQWTRSVAEGGPNEALNNLGFLLYNGLGGPEDPVAAVALWRKASRLSNPESQLHLGEAYEAGKGVEQNPVTAYAWYRCALATVSKLVKTDDADTLVTENAGAALKNLTPHLSDSEKQAGDKLASDLIEKYSGWRISGSHDQ